MPFEVNTRIDITFTEEQIREALLGMVTEQFPDIEVDSLDFVIRRNPTNISARIVASLIGYNSPSCSSETSTGNTTSNGSVEAEATSEPEQPEPVEATASMFDDEPVEDDADESSEEETPEKSDGSVAAILDL